MSEEKVRLDQLLVQQGLAASRERAKAMIMEGLVEVNGTQIDKPGRSFPTSARIVLRSSGPPFVSRGGIKLEAALDHFSVDVSGSVLMDVGASTGGFTDCLLQRGAQKVIAVDVGYGQLAWKLRKDPRVRLLERTNIRHLRSKDLGEPVQGAVVDVSFISLRVVIPVVSQLLTPRAWMIALIKPQFEVGKGQVGKGGVVREPELHRQVIDGIQGLLGGLDWSVTGHIPSPILGPKGNREFLMYAKR